MHSAWTSGATPSVTGTFTLVIFIHRVSTVHFKTVFQSAPEHAISYINLKILKRRPPAAPIPPQRLDPRAEPSPRYQNPNFLNTPRVQLVC